MAPHRGIEPRTDALRVASNVVHQLHAPRGRGRGRQASMIAQSVCCSLGYLTLSAWEDIRGDALGQEIGVAAVPRVLCDLRHQGPEVAHVSLWSTDDPGVVAA
jgi:hypothetical protein